MTEKIIVYEQNKMDKNQYEFDGQTLINPPLLKVVLYTL